VPSPTLDSIMSPCHLQKGPNLITLPAFPITALKVALPVAAGVMDGDRFA
jgi:hypothetical protein